MLRSVGSHRFSLSSRVLCVSVVHKYMTFFRHCHYHCWWIVATALLAAYRLRTLWSAKQQAWLQLQEVKVVS